MSGALFVTAPPGDNTRIFIVQQIGLVRILNLQTGILNTTPFLDISNLLALGGEQGLLGMAFDPNFSTAGNPGQGKFYLNFVVQGGQFGEGVTHVSQYPVSADPNVADTSVERVVLAFDQPQANHNGGWIGFSPRPADANNLYISSGDGGNGNDQGPGHIEPGGNAQNATTLLGKMLRIHIDSGTGTYTIPPDNPFAGAMPPTRQEIWLLGLRNPFRASFDRLNGFMFIGDVGQSTREEVDVQKPGNPGGGENYGWRDREGFIQNPAFGLPSPSPTPSPAWIDPRNDYPREVGATVIGGYVYRGSKIPGLIGLYMFGDYVFGKIFTLNYDGTNASNFQDVTSQLFPIPLPEGGTVNLSNPSAFGEGADGELYLTDIGNGNVFKIVPVLASVVSRKTHGAAGTFDIGLPKSGPPGIECRTGGGSGNHTVVFTFANPIGSVTDATVTSGTGSVSSRLINPGDNRQYFVSLTGVSNGQTITVTLSGVTDAAGHDRGDFAASMMVLLGDTSANGRVNASDVSQTKSQTGNSLSSSNFREDVTVDGSLNSSDVSLVKSQLGTARR